MEMRIKQLELMVSALMSSENGITISNNNVSTTPTDAELDTAFGDAAGLYNGFIGLLNDNSLGISVYLCVVVDNEWWYESLTKAI